MLIFASCILLLISCLFLFSPSFFSCIFIFFSLIFCFYPTLPRLLSVCVCLQTRACQIQTILEQFCCAWWCVTKKRFPRHFPNSLRIVPPLYPRYVYQMVIHQMMRTCGLKFTSKAVLTCFFYLVYSSFAQGITHCHLI